jgi:hypothetical protein
VDLVIFAITLPVFVLGVLAIGKWILGPIDRAARTRNAPVQFSIADFLCLFIVVQVPLAAAFQFSQEEETAAFYWLLTAITWIVAPVIWLAATRALSKAGISAGMHRLMLMGLIVPIAYYGLIPFVIMSMAGPVLVVTNEWPRIAGFHWYVVVWFVLGVLLYLSGLFTQWLVRQVEVAPPSELNWLDDMPTGQ